MVLMVTTPLVVDHSNLRNGEGEPTTTTTHHCVKVQNDLFSGIEQSGNCGFHETMALLAISL